MQRRGGVPSAASWATSSSAAAPGPLDLVRVAEDVRQEVVDVGVRVERGQHRDPDAEEAPTHAPFSLSSRDARRDRW